MSAPPVVQPEPEPPVSLAAQNEAAQFAAKELKRGDARSAHLHVGGIIVFWTVVPILLGMLVTWAWHLTTPDRLHFLSQAGIDRLQTILFSFAGSSVFTNVSKKWIGSKSESSDSHSS